MMPTYMPLDPHLLAAVLDDPKDINARLVAADWWEEHGEPRGRLIHKQVQLTNTKHPVDGAIERLACSRLVWGMGGVVGIDPLAPREPNYASVRAAYALVDAEGLLSDPAILRLARAGVFAPQLFYLTFIDGFVAIYDGVGDGWLINAAQLVATEPIQIVRLQQPVSVRRTRAGRRHQGRDRVRLPGYPWHDLDKLTAGTTWQDTHYIGDQPLGMLLLNKTWPRITFVPTWSAS